jgi:hypothetical protein
VERIRKLNVTDRVFSLKDLERFADILDSAKGTGINQGRTTFAVTFEDDYRIEGKAGEVLDEEELNRAHRPVT